MVEERLYGRPKYNDYTEIDLTNEETSYILGTNANESKEGSWPIGLKAKEILFLSDEDCWIRFNHPDAVQHFIPADDLITITQICEKIYMIRDTLDGVLRMWIEG